MKQSVCERWISLADAVALGDRLDEAQAAFYDFHATTCPDCNAESALWRAVSEPDDLTLHSSIRLSVDHEEILRAREFEIECIVQRARVAHGESEPTLRLRVRRPPLVPLRWAGAVAAAVCLVLLGTGYERRMRSSPIPREVRTPAAAPAVVEADLAPRCFEPAQGVRACLDAGSRVELTDLAGPRRIVDLARGRVVVELDPQPPGSTFAVRTPDGVVTALGTIFSVELDDSGETVARCERGHVSVSPRSGGAAETLAAGDAVSVGRRTPARSMEPTEGTRDLTLLAPEEGTLPPTTATPPSAVIVRPPDQGLASGRRAAFTPPSLGAGPYGRSKGLERARALRARGDFQGAASAYQDVMAEHPGSMEAGAAQVSLGDLLLSRLGEPAAALDAFDRYLTTFVGGELGPEASYGRIRALRALGRTQEERAAVVAFLAEHPTGPQADALRRRHASDE